MDFCSKSYFCSTFSSHYPRGKIFGPRQDACVQLLRQGIELSIDPWSPIPETNMFNTAPENQWLGEMIPSLFPWYFRPFMVASTNLGNPKLFSI